MTIKIIDKVGVSAQDAMRLANYLLDNSKTGDGKFNYGGISLGSIFDTPINISMPKPLWISQTNNRKSDSSPIEITIQPLKRII